MQQETPLSEARVDSLVHLFQKDPEGYTTVDKTEIIRELRRWRENFQKEDSAPRPRKKPKLEVAGPDTSLDDLLS